MECSRQREQLRQKPGGKREWHVGRKEKRPSTAEVERMRGVWLDFEDIV